MVNHIRQAIREKAHWQLIYTTGCLLLLLVTSCATTTPASSTPVPTPTAGVQDAARSVAKNFLGAWCRGSYRDMYGLLSASAKRQYAEADFGEYYNNFNLAATVKKCSSFEIQLAAPTSNGAAIDYGMRFDTQIFGELPLINTLMITTDGNRWVVDWSPGQIITGLAPGGLVVRNLTPALRGKILDHSGTELAVTDRAIKIGAVPGQISDHAGFADEYGPLVGLSATEVLQRLTQAKADWYVPLGLVSINKWESVKDRATAESGLIWDEVGVRRYPQIQSAAAVIGYGGQINEADLAKPAYLNYASGTWIGQSGIDGWGESKLAGFKSASLVVVNGLGVRTYIAAQRDLDGSRDVYTTLDLKLQRTVEELLGKQRGAIVVLEPKTGYIRALASFPSFDPNIFVSARTNLESVLKDSSAPLLNRGTQGVLPPGSVFKIVTMSAAIETGLYTEQTRQNCPATWNGLGPNFIKHDWSPVGQGIITLHQALVLSCNPYFWDIGLNLYKQRPDAISDMARQFGLGQSTSLIGGNDAPGQVPDAKWKDSQGQSWQAGDAVNMATGQGELLATPLQIADMIAAVANDGVIYRPTVVERITGTSSQQEEDIQPTVLRKLEIAPGILASVRAAMVDVVSSRSGTANQVFRNFKVTVAGKTGTAENPGGNPHAWFASYAPVDDPQIVVVVIIENGGEGSVVAAPIARKIYEAYFSSSLAH